MDPEQKQQQINDWYHLYSNGIYKFILYMLHDQEQAKDLMQETFIRAYNHIESFDAEMIRGGFIVSLEISPLTFLRKKKSCKLLFR
ncbi:MAG: hypothetical protein LRY73_09275 [Bacillus sp. (in: Bacteria)]|nr:hypothetical protein [Bacillus sp. (in: firmicutes)]